MLVNRVLVKSVFTITLEDKMGLAQIYGRLFPSVFKSRSRKKVDG